MAYEVRVNHEKIWFQELTSIDFSKLRAQDGTDWQALGALLQMPIVTPRNTRRKLRRISMLRPLVIICWMAVFLAAISVVALNYVVYYEARNVNVAVYKLEDTSDSVQGTADVSADFCSTLLEDARDVIKAAEKVDISLVAIFALGSTFVALLLVILVWQLSKWSEITMRERLRHEVNRVLSSHIAQDQYILLDQVILQQPGLNMKRSTVPVKLGMHSPDPNRYLEAASEVTFQQLRSELRQLTKRPGLPLFRLFFVGSDFLKDPETDQSLEHYKAHLHAAVNEQRLKVLSYVPQSEQQRLCQMLLEEGDAVRDLLIYLAENH